MLLIFSSVYASSRTPPPRLSLSATILLACVLALASRISVGSFPASSGEFDAVIVYSPATGTLQVGSELTVNLTLGNWTASTETVIEADAWEEQTFAIGWEIEQIEIDSTLRFEPDEDRFKDWTTGVEWTFGSLDMDFEYKLTRTRGWMSLDVDWASDRAEIDTRVRFRSTGPGRPHLFYDADIEIGFSLCYAETSIVIEMDDDGFDALTLEIDELTIARLPWLTIDIEMERTLTERTFEVEPSIILGGTFCFEIEAVGDGDDHILSDVRLTEFGFEWDGFPIEIGATVYLDPDDWIDDQYAATLELTLEFEATPDSMIKTEVTFLWAGAPASGYKLARIAPSIRLELGDRLAVGLDIDMDLSSRQLNRIGLGIELAW